MPNLKKNEARRLPPACQAEEDMPVPNTTTAVVKSEQAVNDIHLCRSVSIQDRRRMFEHLVSFERSRHWSSLPALEQPPTPVGRGGPGTLDLLRPDSVLDEGDHEPQGGAAQRLESPYRTSSIGRIRTYRAGGHSPQSPRSPVGSQDLRSGGRDRELRSSRLSPQRPSSTPAAIHTDRHRYWL